jgi:hypothetical protein
MRLHVILLNGLVITQNFDITIPQGFHVCFLRIGFAGILLIDGATNALRLSRREIPATDAQQRNSSNIKHYLPGWVDARPQPFKDDMPFGTEKVV